MKVVAKGREQRVESGATALEQRHERVTVSERCEKTKRGEQTELSLSQIAFRMPMGELT